MKEIDRLENDIMTPFSCVDDYTLRMQWIAACFAYWMDHDCGLELCDA